MTTGIDLSCRICGWDRGWFSRKTESNSCGVGWQEIVGQIGGAVEEVRVEESVGLARYGFEVKEVLVGQWTFASCVEHRSGLWFEHPGHWRDEA